MARVPHHPASCHCVVSWLLALSNSRPALTFVFPPCVFQVGHNAGLSHNGISAKFIMFSTLSGDSDENLGLTQQECSSFHNPPISSKLFPSIVNTNCSLKIGDNDSSGDGGISTSRLIIYVAIGVVGLVLLLVIASELYRRSNRRRAMHSHNAALAEAGTGSGVASHRAHMPPAYPMTSRPPAYK